ncbi:MAG: peroxide stress protein YaaA, partial [Lachnospiraceae bacterium]|nr:peroxide stress protein YaaA [Lachnospiraceae bacterium]
IDNSRIIINLASKEYSKCIEKYLTQQDRYITITFCELSGDKLVIKGTYAKMARGEMVRFMAENRIKNPEDIKRFDRFGYVFRPELSSDTEYIFERKTEITSC